MRLRRVWMVLRSRVAVYFPGNWRIRHALITCMIRVRSLFVSNFCFRQVPGLVAKAIQALTAISSKL